MEEEAPADLPGRSLLEATANTSPVYGETYYANIHYGWSPVLTLRTDRWTYIDAPAPELYDRLLDPGEKVNLHDREAAAAAELAAKLKSLTRHPAAVSEKGIDEDTEERLQSLGYAAQSGAPKNLEKDPKRLIATANALFRGITLQSEGKPREALVYLQRAYRDDPSNFTVLYHLANCLRVLGDAVSAMSYYQKSIEIFPAGAEAYSHLAILQFENGRREEAFQVLEEGLRHSPRSFALLLTSGDLHLETGDASTAARDYKRAAESEPKRAEPWIGLAQAAEMQGRKEEAEAHWMRAMQINPQHPLIPPSRREAAHRG
jgi:Flp pilus assembly protein TadD